MPAKDLSFGSPLMRKAEMALMLRPAQPILIVVEAGAAAAASSRSWGFQHVHGGKLVRIAQ